MKTASRPSGPKRLLEISREISQVLNVDALLGKVLDAAIEVTGAERGCLLILEPGVTDIPAVKNDWGGVQKRVFGASEFSPSRSIIRKVLESRNGILERNALKGGSASVMAQRLQSVLCEPLLVPDAVIGVIYLDSSVLRGLFDRRHKELLRSLASQAAVCIHNARLFSEVQEATRRQMEERTRALEMEARRNSMAAFVSIAAHDLKNPLTVMQGGLQVLERSDLPERARRIVEPMSRSVHRAVNLVQTYLDVMRLEDGLEVDLSNIGEVDLKAAVERQLDQVSVGLAESERSRYPLHSDVESDLRVLVDKFRLEQILGNLIDNAIKYSPDGSSITVRARRLDGVASIEVSDTGPGMTEDTRARLFRKFIRGEATHNVPGTGLGLWITERLIQRHGGAIEVESALGRGTTFRFTLPVAVPARV